METLCRRVACDGRLPHLVELILERIVDLTVDFGIERMADLFLELQVEFMAEHILESLALDLMSELPVESNSFITWDYS